MDNSAVDDLLEELSGNIDDLEAALKPLLDVPIQATATSLHPLDKAKLYIWTSYAIETLIFNYIRLNGVDGKTHPVFTELKRIQQYMQKIEVAAGPTAHVNMGVAGRFIKHGLAGNEKWDKERAEMKEKERLAANKKLEDLEAKMVAEGKLTKAGGEDEDAEKAAKKERKLKRKEEKARLEAEKGGPAGDATVVPLQSAEGILSKKKPKKSKEAT